MMRNLRSPALVLVVVIGGPFATAAAQDDDAVVLPEVAVQAPPSLSGDEQVAQAAEIEARGQALSQRFQGMLDAARKSGDIIKVTCLNDKLTQANANVRGVQQRKEALSSAVAVGDGEGANHEYTVLTVLNQKFSSLEHEAGQCIGEDVYESGAAQTTADIDKDAPTDVDPTKIPEKKPLPLYMTVPPPFSPSI